ncbi:DUF3068 domain-containing protein [Nocardia salmonicida]|uniref:DUF3068 domain-containing protein n=1 Tax=Nocardia salmonicida TaxID=53431 RepID=UPI002E2E788D|nr:DUF3068 domain-containing protein [Nocardia salmonicida]
MSSAPGLVGNTLLGISAFCVTSAVLLTTHAPDRLAKTPLDLAVTVVSTTAAAGTRGGQILDSTSMAGEQALRVLDDVPLMSQRYVTVVEPSDSETMTAQSGAEIRRLDIEDGAGLLSATITTVTVDRVSASPTPNGRGSIQTSSSGVADEVDFTGMTSKLPMGTLKKSYPYFDTIARRSAPLEYVDESKIDGVAVLRFRQQIDPIDLATAAPNVTGSVLTLPRSKWGLSTDQQPLTLHRWYSTFRELWVEPVTGMIVDARESPHIYYAETSDRPVVPVMSATLRFDSDSRKRQMAMARSAKVNIDRLFTVAPQILAATAAAAAAGGLGLLVRRAKSARRIG